MSGTIVVDYGIGNVFSVCNALRAIGCEAELTDDITAIRKADRVILPGVGAFARAMAALHDKGISDALRDFVQTGRPFLGICIGMQVLMDRSSEFGDTEGLGFVRGTVERIASESPFGQPLRVPHIGWAPLAPSQGSEQRWKGTVLDGADYPADSVYFVHSYHCRPANAEERIAHIDYEGLEVTAAIRRDNITGLQFHPERSSRAGQKILERFLAL
ncbi:imidazole glycerol phosphate synthase subunit HisH [Devosia rhizoryzae]|uniref:Imidazole glycerol phosphate synthase subunit HisH n=1 Tax=Devosia rhizoryzae TaxID=2774137 RepID=A0ABX7C3T1_9HYPH|nr:imidazole glycerol phosphate synthase subunit HisH [Devosia rhizoryzae]QQR38402.1 imidazole glycerol phosphate synthase subunit HisH [Devosia rhizoryzae]